LFYHRCTYHLPSIQSFQILLFTGHVSLLYVKLVSPFFYIYFDCYCFTYIFRPKYSLFVMGSRALAAGQTYSSYFPESPEVNFEVWGRGKWGKVKWDNPMTYAVLSYQFCRYRVPFLNSQQ
jgi:hypothetical protein